MKRLILFIAIFGALLANAQEMDTTGTDNRNRPRKRNRPRNVAAAGSTARATGFSTARSAGTAGRPTGRSAGSTG